MGMIKVGFTYGLVWVAAHRPPSSKIIFTDTGRANIRNKGPPDSLCPGVAYGLNPALGMIYSFIERTFSCSRVNATLQADSADIKRTQSDNAQLAYLPGCFLTMTSSATTTLGHMVYPQTREDS